MVNIFKKSNSIMSKPLMAPVILLVVTLLAYGLSIWGAGFYWDDQPISWIRYQLGTEATTKYFSDSRPVWALLYQLTGFVLPLKPVYWQLFALFWRWVGAFVFWLMMERLFPRRKGIAFLLTVLVLLYPGFNQQWVSYVYSHFFIVLFFLLISWYLMLRGRTIPAMIFSALNLLMLEYFFLLELIRPAIIFMSLRDAPMTDRERFIRTFKAWLPYLGVIIFAVLYRMFVYSHPGFGYSLKDEITKAPVETLLLLAKQVVSSVWIAAVGAWTLAFQFPTPATKGLRTTLLYVIVVLVVGILVYFFTRTDEGKENGTKRDSLWLIGLGVVMLLLGGVPYWMTNLPISIEFPANRALLSFMFGSCFLLLGLIDLLPARVRYLAAILFVALSAGRQFVWSIDYLRDWQSQKDLFWQMTWRAPGIKPGTLILTNEKLSFNADNSISAPLNWIYSPRITNGQLPYLLFYPTNRLGASLPELKPDIPIHFSYIVADFNGNTSDALAFYYNPPACLRLLDPVLDSDNRFISEESLMREASALSNADRIIAAQEAVMPAIYGPEPEYGWCYYFEKADLARQFGDWETVARLSNEAFSLDDYPNNPLERFVFIEGYAHVGKWDRALELSNVSYGVSKDFVGPMLCRLWERIETETTDGVGRSEALSKAGNLFACNP